MDSKLFWRNDEGEEYTEFLDNDLKTINKFKEKDTDDYFSIKFKVATPVVDIPLEISQSIPSDVIKHVIGYHVSEMWKEYLGINTFENSICRTEGFPVNKITFTFVDFLQDLHDPSNFELLQIHRLAEYINTLSIAIPEYNKIIYEDFSKIGFWVEILSDKPDLHELTYEIDQTIAAAISGTVEINENQFLNKLFARSSLVLKSNRSSSLSFNNNIIKYDNFPNIVKGFIRDCFGVYINKYPELREKIKVLSVYVLPRPKDYTKDVCGELLSLDKIAFYLPKPNLKYNWKGIIHEVTHIVQSVLNGAEENIPLPPKTNSIGYILGTKDYYEDPGEIHAYAVANMFEDVEKNALISREFDDIKLQNYKMFKDRFDRHGDIGSDIFWSGRNAQETRFDVFLSFVDFNDKNVLDIGCGFGDFIKYLEKKGIKPKNYVGVDIVPDIVEVAKKHNPNYQFEERDVLENPFNNGSFDVVIASGIFALPHKSYNDYVIDMFNIMCSMSSGYAIANFLKKNEYNKDKGLKYNDPENTLKMVQYRVNENAVLKDDYLYDDFTICVGAKQ